YLQTVQLARDAGHMFARGVDFTVAGNQSILIALGGNVGLRTSGGNAVVILSALTYVDVNACAAVGATSGGVPTSACTNYQQWVFAQRQQSGSARLRTRNFGSRLTSGPNSVTMDSSGKISISDYVKKSGARATFNSANGIHPYTVVNGQASGLPSGQKLFV